VTLTRARDAREDDASAFERNRTFDRSRLHARASMVRRASVRCARAEG
jgi:hypothetical protein